MGRSRRGFHLQSQAGLARPGLAGDEDNSPSTSLGRGERLIEESDLLIPPNHDGAKDLPHDAKYRRWGVVALWDRQAGGDGCEAFSRGGVGLLVLSAGARHS
jgi:hypothetical protein